ncbi:MAG: hypothetical protein ACO3JL_00790 [Myxococcota bacterium]
MTSNSSPSLLRRAWRVLMTPVGRRLPVGKRGAPHGIALFMVLIALALMSSVVTDFGYNELVRYRLATHERDGLRAQALSDSGVNLARLLLAVQAAVQPMLTQLAAAGIPLPAHTVWNLIPLDSELLKSLTAGELQSMFGMDVSAAVAERKEAADEKRQTLLEDFEEGREGAGAGPFVPPESGFGAFLGDFTVQIDDEEKKAVSLRGFTTQVNPQARWAYVTRLMALFAPERYDFLFEERDSRGNRVDRLELIANLHDYADGNEDATDPRATQADWGRQGGGAEDGLYSSYRGVEPKNGYFDSHAELLRVHGFSDAHMKAFGEQISIYAESKVNLLSAAPQAIEYLVRICATDPYDYKLIDPLWMQETLQLWNECKMLGILGGCQLSPQGFTTFLDGRGLLINAQQCQDNISLESKNFTVRVTANVNDVTRTTTLVARVHGAAEEFYYYSVR